MSHAPQAYETQGTARPGGDQPHVGVPGAIQTLDSQIKGLLL